jgi:hypothetical protein
MADVSAWVGACLLVGVLLAVVLFVVALRKIDREDAAAFEEHLRRKYLPNGNLRRPNDLQGGGHG